MRGRTDSAKKGPIEGPRLQARKGFLWESIARLKEGLKARVKMLELQIEIQGVHHVTSSSNHFLTDAISWNQCDFQRRLASLGENDERRRKDEEVGSISQFNEYANHY